MRAIINDKLYDTDTAELIFEQTTYSGKKETKCVRKYYRKKNGHIFSTTETVYGKDFDIYAWDKDAYDYESMSGNTYHHEDEQKTVRNEIKLTCTPEQYEKIFGPASE